MSDEKYDKSSAESILEYAIRLTGKSLFEALGFSPEAAKAKNKGGFGTQVEKYYFGIPTNNSMEPDFSQAGVELKVTGLVRNGRKSFKPKERLILKMIDYMSIIDESWETSALLKKCRLMLIVFYLYDKDAKSILDYRFVKQPILFNFPQYDAIQIQQDWEFIQRKIMEGRAHELSEGDTMYLGACRKGSGGTKEKKRAQPFSEIRANGRAYSLKPQYVQKIIDGTITESVIEESQEVGIAEATLRRFKPYEGIPVEELMKKFNVGRSKNYLKVVAMRILGTQKKSIPELDRAGVVIKTVCVNSKWRPKESMSFKSFRFKEVVNQKWEDSDFCATVETKFLLVVFRFDETKTLRLEFATYWNMPYEDREEARRVWEVTQKRIKSDPKRLPKISESRVAHVRPHGRNAKDIDITPGGVKLTKQCFWLNAGYIASVIEGIRTS